MIPAQESLLAALAGEPCTRGAARLSEAELAGLLASLPGWAHVGDRIAKTWRFGNYHETIAFVNAIAWIAHRADHHPDLSVHYNRCVVSFSTHDAGGVTRNDMICAARVERLSA